MQQRVREGGLAGRSATLVLQLCALGGEARRTGTCLGIDVGERFQIVEGAVSLAARRGTRPQRWRWHQRSLTHRARGHEPGCASLGISFRELHRLLRIHLRSDIAEYLAEVFVPVESWEQEGNVERVLGPVGIDAWVDFAVRQRITPLPLVQGAELRRPGMRRGRRPLVPRSRRPRSRNPGD